ncbi:pentapeptide repeat-containing protein [Kitasatospora sp. NPDC091335]|uniref:pentapeptide repeat-containing protein n=1 Tax=Kitasatospora sp. NPDC091335 TaxID=3364085 RepID=UPI0038154561
MSRSDLSHADLAGSDVSRPDVPGADLSRADLAVGRRDDIERRSGPDQPPPDQGADQPPPRR